ncbi:phage tail protein [Serratia marcescens]|uniref:phage tail-collar fiber domain-containing protein n=1 Tax=Serratia marcescens TaxID=615 RepID=UPI003D76B9BA
MSQTVITAAFEQWKAQEAAGGKPVVLDGFVLANVPGLNPDTPISNTEGMPPDAQIVYRQDVDKVGVVNNNAVVYSITMGSNVGTFDFNWIGLVNKASGTVAMIVHAPMQRKLKTEDGQQGNAVNRSFLMEYDGAATETQINTPAQTWQIDFTARLAGMDEVLRLANVDIYGAGAFFGDGYLVTKTGAQYAVSAGSGYVGGIRTTLAAAQNIAVTTKPTKVWLDVSWQGTLTGQWHAITAINVSATELKDHTDANGFAHYVFAVASIDASGAITDLRPQGSLTNQLAEGSVLTVNNIKADDKRNVTVPLYGLGLGPVAKTDAYSNIAQFFRVDVGSANAPPIAGNIAAGVVSLPCDAAPSTGYLAVSGMGDGWLGRSGAVAGGVTWSRIFTDKNKPTTTDVKAADWTSNFAAKLGIARVITGANKPTSPGIWSVENSTWTPYPYGTLYATTNGADLRATSANDRFIHYLFIAHGTGNKLFVATDVNGVFGEWFSYISSRGGTFIGQIISPSFASTPETMPNGAGAFADQLSLQAPFFQPNWQWPVNAGGLFVPIAKGTSTRKDKGYPGAVSFGYLMPANDEHPHPTIHVKGDSNVDTAWDFNPYSGAISSKAGTFATQEWVNTAVHTNELHVGEAQMAQDGNIWGTRWDSNGGWLWDAIMWQVQNIGQMAVSGDHWWVKINLNGGTLIVQGGRAVGTDNDGGVTDRINLNISVPNRLLHVSMNIKNFGQGYDSGWNPQVGDLTYERDGFSWFHGSKDRDIYWLAVGY